MTQLYQKVLETPPGPSPLCFYSGNLLFIHFVYCQCHYNVLCFCLRKTLCKMQIQSLFILILFQICMQNVRDVYRGTHRKTFLKIFFKNPVDKMARVHVCKSYAKVARLQGYFSLTFILFFIKIK